MDKPGRLNPRTEIVINPYSIVIGSLIFALIFFAIGALWRYYIPIGV